MSVFVSFFVATFLFVFVLLWWGKKRHPKFPPGKTGVPFLGILPMLTRQPCKLFKKWSLEKGWPVMSVRIMNTDIVLLNKFEVVHQVLKYLMICVLWCFLQTVRDIFRAFNAIMSNYNHVS